MIACLLDIYNWHVVHLEDLYCWQTLFSAPTCKKMLTMKTFSNEAMCINWTPPWMGSIPVIPSRCRDESIQSKGLIFTMYDEKLKTKKM